MKKLVCDICRSDIKYNGVIIRFKSLFSFLFRKAWPGENSDYNRIDLCNRCFDRMRDLVLNPNTIQDLRAHLAVSNSRRRPVVDRGGDVPTAEIPPQPIAEAYGLAVAESTRTTEAGANGR